MKLEIRRFWWDSRRRVPTARSGWPHAADYTFRLSAPSERGARVTAESILRWLNHAIATRHASRRNDRLALALACRDATGRVVCSNALGALGPGAVDEPDLAGRIEAFLDEVRVVYPGDGAEISAALLSLGDAAHDAGQPRAA